MSATPPQAPIPRDIVIQNTAAMMMITGTPCVFCGRRATPSTSKRRWIGMERNGEIAPAHIACARKWAQVVAQLIVEVKP